MTSTRWLAGACAAVAATVAVAQSVEVPRSGVAVRATRVVAGLTAPVGLVAPGDGSGLRFVVEQHGVVRVLEAGGTLREAPLLDIRDRLVALSDGFEERGLLGFALHPQFPHDGRVFASYSAPLAGDAPRGWNHTRRIAEFSLASDAPLRVDPGSERTLLAVHWPSRKHNGGGLAFGNDGLLYIGLGDGGGVHGVGAEVLYDAFESPPSRHRWDSAAQDVSSLYGAILRIDVDRGFPGYAVPAHNPWVGRAGRAEIWAWGFRNPYRLGVDRLGTGDLFVTAVGETLWEAIYRVDRPGNYGWALKEGTHCFDRAAPFAPPARCAGFDAAGYPLLDPVVEYPNRSVERAPGGPLGTGLGTAAVGGLIYRGAAIPGLRGRLVFADWSADFMRPSGQLFVASPPPEHGAQWRIERLLELDTRIIGLGEDAAGELHILTNDALGPSGDSGAVYRLQPR